MFTKSHNYYDEIYAFKDYRQASAELLTTIRRHCPHARTLLDVACGTGRHLENFSLEYDCQGVDINEHLVDQATKRCGSVTFHVGNMIDFSLGKKFDVVTLLFSSIAYAKHKDNLVKTICNLERHLAENGIVLIEPWFSPERYWTGTITANHVDKTDLKICWMYASDPPVGNVASLNMKFMVGTPSGIEVFDELHELGLFTREDWQAAFDAASLDVEYDPKGPFSHGLYILRRSQHA